MLYSSLDDLVDAKKGWGSVVATEFRWEGFLARSCIVPSEPREHPGLSGNFQFYLGFLTQGESKKNLISTGPGWLDHSHHTVLSIALDRWDPSELTKTAILYLAWSLLLFLGCNGIPKMKRSKYVTPLLKFFQKKFFGTNERRRCLASKRNAWIR